MPRVVMSILGASIEIEDETSTSIKLVNLAMKSLREAIEIPTPKSGGPGSAGFHIETAPPRAENVYAPATLHPDVRKR